MKPLNNEKNNNNSKNKQKDRKYQVPDRKTKKKTAGKNVRISEEHYDIIRTISFNEERTIKDVIDSILEEHLDNS